MRGLALGVYDVVLVRPFLSPYPITKFWSADLKQLGINDDDYITVCRAEKKHMTLPFYL